MKNIGIFLNPHYFTDEPVFALLEKLHREKDIQFYNTSPLPEELPSFILDASALDAKPLFCILVFGGDGTMLRAVDVSLKHKAPLLGINIGGLGFLSDSSMKELEKSVDDLLKGKFSILKRMLLEVVVKRDGKPLFGGRALNDAVIYKGNVPKLIDLTVSSNRRLVLDTRCDGIVISTPTGSTAYSLSAGGPILSPEMDAIVTTPLNPHVLTVRPIVFSSHDQLRFRIIGPEEDCILQLDGKNNYTVTHQDVVKITGASQKVCFIKLNNKTFYSILRKKMHLGRK
jgi:NAD+ kinase